MVLYSKNSQLRMIWSPLDILFHDHIYLAEATIANKHLTKYQPPQQKVTLPTVAMLYKL